MSARQCAAHVLADLDGRIDAVIDADPLKYWGLNRPSSPVWMIASRLSAAGRPARGDCALLRIVRTWPHRCFAGEAVLELRQIHAKACSVPGSAGEPLCAGLPASVCDLKPHAGGAGRRVSSLSALLRIRRSRCDSQ